MILDPTKPLGAAELYLRTLTAFAPPHTLLDVRYRTSGHDLGQLFLDADTHNAARTIVRISRWTDVYVGVAQESAAAAPAKTSRRPHSYGPTATAPQRSPRSTPSNPHPP